MRKNFQTSNVIIRLDRIIQITKRWIPAFAGMTAILLIPHLTNAARIVFEPQTLPSGSQINVLLDPEGSDINGIRGEIALTGTTNSLGVEISNSIVPLWTDEPVLQNGSISFSGIIPGGFSGILVPDREGTKPGLLFVITFKPTASNRVQAVARHVTAYLNDGEGTSLSLPLSQVDFTPPATDARGTLDGAPPATFRIYVGRDESIFGGHWFASWSTVDRNSGIDHFEIRETRPGEDGNWVTAESPYELKDQDLKSAIDVKAIDVAGNVRLAHLDAQNRLSWTDWMKKNVIIIMLSSLALLIICAKFYLRPRSS